MPLKDGASDATVSANVAELIRSGKTQEQAVAIAMKHAGRGPLAEALVMAERLRERHGWSAKSAAEAAEHAVRARYGSRGLAVWAAKGVEVRVPQVRQATNYTCGPACLRAALAAIGIAATEDELAVDADTTAQGGTCAAGLAEAAIVRGAKAEVVDGLTVDRLVELLADGCVVIAGLQAYAREASGGDYEDFWENGHWVVPVAIRIEEDPPKVLAMDPLIDGAHSALTIDEWEERWHTWDGGEQTVGLGVVLQGEQPARMALVLPQAALE